MRSENRQTKEGIGLPNQEKKNQNVRRNGKLQVIGNIGSRHHKKSGEERKNKKKKEYIRRTRKLLETKLNFNRINTPMKDTRDYS